MQGKYLYNSADNHLDSRWLPKDLWQSRLSSKFKDSAPKVVETADGSFWEWEGKLRDKAADGTSNAPLLKHFFPVANPPAGSRPPADAQMLLKHMDMAGIYAGVYYGDTRKWGIEDEELRLAVFYAYNDFVMELSKQSPDRLVVLPNLPTFAPEKCLAELKRMIAAGAKGIEFGCFDVAKPLFDEVWEPVFALAAEAGIPVCCHIGDRAGVSYPPNTRGSSFAHFSTTPFALAKQIPIFIFSGLFERHPKLHVSIAECRIGWLPFLISWMDRQARVREPDPTIKLSMLPSDYVKRNMSFTFEEDYLGARLIPHDWAYIKDSVVWGSDYPHEQGTWPDASQAIDTMFAGVDPNLKHEILFERTARLFNVANDLKKAAA
jgi:predicted TIM-barrel fold metal-dependent hydrolase